MKLLRPIQSKPAFVEFASQGRPTSSIDQIPKDDTLQYIQDMCVTLSYMAGAKQSERLATLLSAAAAEAERQIASPQNQKQPIDDVVAYSITSKT